MARNRQHQWEPVPDTDLVKCTKCGTEVTAIQARRGAGPCKWGESDKMPPVPNPEEETEQARIMREVNLCSTCAKECAECDGLPKYGTGVGNDNVYECDGYTKGEKPAFSAQEPPATDPEKGKEGVRYFLGDIEITREEAIEQGKGDIEGLRDGVTAFYDHETTEPPLVINVKDGVKIEGIDTPPKHPGPRLTDPPEYCNACGTQIAILPLNSKIDMVACNNHRCTMFRERLRMVTKPVERGKRAKG